MDAPVVRHVPIRHAEIVARLRVLLMVIGNALCPSQKGHRISYFGTEHGQCQRWEGGRERETKIANAFVGYLLCIRSACSQTEWQQRVSVVSCQCRATDPAVHFAEPRTISLTRQLPLFSH